MMTDGIFWIHFSHEIEWSRLLMLEIAPTTATGMAQKMMSAQTKEMVAMFLMIRSHHLILRFFQMTSSGLTPMKRGLMCRAW